MLSIYLGQNYLFMDNKISYVSEYFDAEYEESWFESDMAKHIIRTIDKSEYIEGEFIKSPVLGGISPRDLSTGCKALLLLLNEPELIVSGDRMGDNCYPILFEMAKHNDYTITLCHWPDLHLCDPFEFKNARTGKLVTTMLDFMREYDEEEKLSNE